MGYNYQFITLAGFHSLNLATFKLAKAYRQHGMAGYSELQQAEFAVESEGYTATRHQREVGTSYFRCGRRHGRRRPVLDDSHGRVNGNRAVLKIRSRLLGHDPTAA